MAVAQLRNQTKGRAYYDARRAGDMPAMMAIRALKRRMCNIVFARMLAAQRRREASPGGQSGTTTDSSVTGTDLGIKGCQIRTFTAQAPPHKYTVGLPALDYNQDQ